MKLVIARSALHDLQEIQSYYREQGVPAIGLQLIESILTQARKLVDHPDVGKMVPELGQEHIRELIIPPFRVVYLRSSSSVSLIRVWRSERLLHLPEEV